MTRIDEIAEEELAWSWEANRRRQVRRGLELTPAERLQWLETALAEVRLFLGRAQRLAEGQPRQIPGRGRTAP
jgi:hypothetical protein